MSKSVKPGANEAAEYVRGLLGQEDSRAFAQRPKSDEALRAQVEYWEGMFSDLPPEQAELPPAGMFEKILDRIEGEGADLPGTVTRRAGTAN
jgi:anti-sigma-K factor RskA